MVALRTPRVKASVLDSWMDLLDRNAVEVPPAEQVFKATRVIVALVKVVFFLPRFHLQTFTVRRAGQDDLQQRCRATIRMLFRHVREVEDYDLRKGCG